MKQKLYNLFRIKNICSGTSSLIRLGMIVIALQCSIVGSALGQTSKVNINVQNTKLENVFQLIQQQTGFQVFYSHDIVNPAKLVSFQAVNLPLNEALGNLLPQLGLTYKLVDKTIVLSKLPPAPKKAPATSKVSPKSYTIHGVIKDENGNPMVGVTVKSKENPTLGVISDLYGKYAITLPESTGNLNFSMIGSTTQIVPLNGQAEINVILESKTEQLQEQIVTGYARKAKNSFAGTAVQVKGADLRNISPTNFFDALKIFDPSFAVIDKKGLYGSDPNRVPDHIEIRGQNSIPDISQNTLETYTSLPIFMLDGFPISVQQVYDLDMNRIQSVTILKDAAAASIYGSRAANGVVVIETTVPEGGKLRVSYTFNGSLEVPDLSSYNLMNSSELLEFYRRSNLFNNGDKGDNTSSNIYENLLGGNPGRQNLFMLLSKEVENGVDSYWLSQPVKTAFQHEHTVTLEGGAKISQRRNRDIRYQVTLNTSLQDGVMKGSDRNRYGAGVKLIYNGANLRITSDIQGAVIKNNESPYGNFGTYAKLLPFYRMTGSDGRYLPSLSYENIPIYEGFPRPDFTGLTFAPQYNPIYEAKYLSNFDRGETTNLIYNLGFNWSILEELRVQGTFSVNNSLQKNECYRSPLSSEFFQYSPANDQEKEGANIYSRGRYTMGNTSDIEYSGRISATYTKEVQRHLFQFLLGGEMREKNYSGDSYVSVGFLDDPLSYPSYAIQFKPNSGPSGSSSVTRLAGAFANFNYSWDNRYLIDITGRMDASSIFARNNRTAPFWATALRWNIFNEPFMKSNGIFENLALRASIGTTGNQNFQLSQIMTLYRYLGMYEGVTGSEIMSIANTDLKWQTTLEKNIGLEFSMLRGLLNFEFNLYSKLTRDNLTDIALLPSTGFNTYKANLGKVRNNGYDFNVSITPIRTPKVILNFFVNGTHNTNKILTISDALRNYNESVIENQVATSGQTLLQNIYKFEEGGSLNSIYAVRSLGIDPGTGKEIFLTRDGKKTNVWNAADQVVVGNTEPTLMGFFGLNLTYKQWSLHGSFQYSFGADQYNETLYSKMEGGEFNQNQDRRALDGRWTEPGTFAQYKGYSDFTKRNPTSRFVQRENFLSMSSLRLTYSLNQRNIKFAGLSLLKISLSTNDLFYVSTIKQERGLIYPFARKFYLTLQANF